MLLYIAGEALASSVFKLGMCWPKQLDYEIPFAHSVYLFFCLLRHSPCAKTVEGVLTVVH